MIQLNQILLIAVALSMDAFSVAIMIGINPLKKSLKVGFVLLVGIFHLLFPLGGYLVGHQFLTGIWFNNQKVLGLILLLLAFQMTAEYFHTIPQVKPNLLPIIGLALTVSFDSLMTGVGLYQLKKLIFPVAFIFALMSTFFSLIGIRLGSQLEKLIGTKSKLIGILLLLLLGIKYFFF